MLLVKLEYEEDHEIVKPCLVTVYSLTLILFQQLKIQRTQGCEKIIQRPRMYESNVENNIYS